MECAYCKRQVPDDATKCPYCLEWQPKPSEPGKLQTLLAFLLLVILILLNR